jgi:hypothetical protein
MPPFEGWLDESTPPSHWNRALSFDVGGATNNALEWVAICPETQSIVAYDEVIKITTDIRMLAGLCKPKMIDPTTGNEYNFVIRVGDFENRVALDDMGRHGIRFNNAVKTNKNLSIQRMSQYLHPNPMRPFPGWHPRAGQLGAPLMYIMPACKQLIKEIPLQKWKVGEGDQIKDEMDRNVQHDAVDCILYIVRMLAAPASIPVPKVIKKESKMNLISRLYWEDVKRLEQSKNGSVQHRKAYNPAHQGGQIAWKLRQ